LTLEKCGLSKPQVSQYHQRSRDGAEEEFIIEHDDGLTPIEVKWTEHPTVNDARHLLTFLHEKKQKAKRGYVVCR